MSNPAAAPAAHVDKGAESPTTAHEIDFDEEHQEGANSQTQAPKPSPPIERVQKGVRFQETEEAPPPKPPRPMSPQQQNEAMLIEAFPSIDSKVIKAVLTASGGNVERAFNALLGMSDPEYQGEEPLPPPQPPRLTTQQRQLQQDELYARQLAEHYNSRGSHSGYSQRSASLPQQSHPEEREYSFIDDDLPEIRENLRQGFISTQNTVNRWISDIRKRIDGDESEEENLYGHSSPAPRQSFGPSQSDQIHGIQREAEARSARRSTDRERYDDDPQVLSGNFTELELRDNEEEEKPPPKPARPQANPNLFKPTPAAPQKGPVDEVDAVYGSVNRNPSPVPPSGGKSKRWQPLTSVALDPQDDDNDPFSLGDSEDEKDAKTKDLRSEDTARLKQAASENAPAKAGTETQPTLTAAERSGSSGTRNKEAEDILEGNASTKG